MKTLKDYSLWITQTLLEAGIEEGRQESVIILSELLNMDRLRLKLNEDMILVPEQIKTIKNIVSERVSRKPLQYILKKAWFYGYEFYIEEGVFIPRPETEILVDSVINLAKRNLNPALKIVDVCTGSGCITLSLALNLPDASLYTVDINPKAIEIASLNAAKLNIPANQIHFLHGDRFEPLGNEKFDFIVSNPPYISSQDINYLEPEVKFFDPGLALDGGVTGFDFYEYFAKEAKKHLNSDGYICVEIGYGQSDGIRKLFEENYWKTEDIIKDFNNIDRVIIASGKV